MKALVIPVEGPVYELEDPSLADLQKAVDGFIEAVPVPDFITDAEKATAYVHDEGKYHDWSKLYPIPEDCDPIQARRLAGGFNMRATDFMVPGIGLFVQDYIAGPFVLCGFNVDTGEHAELPKSVVDRVRLIEREAG